MPEYEFSFRQFLKTTIFYASRQRKVLFFVLRFFFKTENFNLYFIF